MNSSTSQSENPDVDSLAETAEFQKPLARNFMLVNISYCQEPLRSLLVKAAASPRYPTKETEVTHAQKARKGKGRSRPKGAEEEFLTSQMVRKAVPPRPFELKR